MKHRNVVVLTCIALVAGLCALGLASFQRETVRFAYRPPDGTKCTERATLTRVVSVGTDKTTTQGTMAWRAVVKRTGSGYRNTNTLLSSSVTRNGQVQKNTLDGLLIGLPITYEIDRNGQLKAVKGYGEARKRLEAKLGPEQARKMPEELSEKAMVSRVKQEWKERFGEFAGRTVPIGSAMVSVRPYALPYGDQTDYYRVTRVLGRVTYAGHSCVKIRFDYHSNAKALAKLVGRPVNEITAPNGKKLRVTQMKDATVTGGGERIIDPATMLLYAESSSRDLSLKMQGPAGKPVTFTTSEKQVRTFKY